MAKAPSKPDVERQVEKSPTTKIHDRSLIASLDAVGRSLQKKTFAGFGFALVIFDKSKPDQFEVYAGADKKATAKALAAALKKMEG